MAKGTKWHFNFHWDTSFKVENEKTVVGGGYKTDNTHGPQDSLIWRCSLTAGPGSKPCSVLVLRILPKPGTLCPFLHKEWRPSKEVRVTFRNWILHTLNWWWEEREKKECLLWADLFCFHHLVIVSTSFFPFRIVFIYVQGSGSAVCLFVFVLIDSNCIYFHAFLKLKKKKLP